MRTSLSLLKIGRLGILGAMLALFTASGCNLWGGIDSTSSREETHAEALVKMDDNKCSEASKDLDAISNPDNTTYRLRGWAKLCSAGAGVKKVLANLLTFNTSTNNVDIIVTLAKSLVPQTADNITTINSAIASFSSQDTGNDRTVNLILAYMVKAAALIAKQAGDDGTISRSDFSVTGCTTDSSSCVTSANCTVNTSGTMSDADSTDFATTLIQAGVSTNISGGLGSLSDLAKRFSANVSTTVANANRCYIYNTLLTQ